MKLLRSIRKALNSNLKTKAGIRNHMYWLMREDIKSIDPFYGGLCMLLGTACKVMYKRYGIVMSKDIENYPELMSRKPAPSEAFNKIWWFNPYVKNQRITLLDAAINEYTLNKLKDEETNI